MWREETVAQLGGNLIHFGVIISIGLAIGTATPPVAIDICSKCNNVA
ncbi:TRAP transporter large permease subunit [Thermovirga sp.]